VPPFLPYERKGDEIWGRGSVDAKGSVVAQIIAVESLIAQGKIAEGDVALLYVVGEENGGGGMRAANSLGLSWESVIFGEPTDLKLVSGHKGSMSFILRAKGKAGHSGYPEEGKNAIDLLVKGLTALHSLELPSSKRLGESTLNIGKIEGGVAANVIPEDASATVMIRVAASSPENILKLVGKAVHEASPELVVEYLRGLGPVAIDSDIDGERFSTVHETILTRLFRI
jgi:acetylornithine deacetylase